MYCWQRGEGRPLVLIHGMFGDHLDWEPVLEPLAARRRVLAVDLPGFGASPRPGLEYDAELFVESLRELIGKERVSIAGNSFGGQIAMLYALAYPEQVQELILVDTGGFSDYGEDEKNMLAARLSREVILSFTPPLIRFLFDPLFMTPNEHTRRYVERQVAKLAWPDYSAYAAALAASIRLSVNTCLLGRLHEISCPVRMIWGECDQVAPVELAKTALPLFGSAQLSIIPRCGHVPQIEKPVDFIQIVE